MRLSAGIGGSALAANAAERAVARRASVLWTVPGGDAGADPAYMDQKMEGAASYLIGRGQVAEESNRHRSGHVNRASGSCPVRRQGQSLRTAARRALRIGAETPEGAASQPASYLIAVE